MTTIESLGVELAAERSASGAAHYVDVRTVAEFEAGHVPGASNVPWALSGPAGMAPNPEFLAVMERRFAKDAPLIVGCRSGRRSLAAARALVGAGFTRIADFGGGWDGGQDAFGRPTEGWNGQGRPVETGDGGERSWAKLSR